MTEGRVLAGKVVAVTGAGRGIGRELALLCARHGAKVVVNDLGGDEAGDGADATPAQEVVDEIRKLGSDAVANGANVADPAGAATIIEDAIGHFGRIDAVMNNAGILRDRMFHKMSHMDWESVIGVHLMGSFNVARAAAPHFRAQESGSFVNFTSTSGLIGQIGQANYAAAKMGVVGLSTGMAHDLKRYNVRSNCIAPFAWSRLIATIPTDTPEQQARVDKLKSMTPDKIAPLAVYLASDLSSGVTGQVFSVRRNEIFLFSQPRPIRSAHCEGGWTPEAIHERVRPAFETAFTPLEVTGDVFPWDPQ